MLLSSLLLAIRSIRRNLLRSFLTILGVFIGVVIIVGVASVLNGFRQSVVDQVEEFGTNNIYVYRFPFVQTDDLSADQRQRRKLTLEDAWALEDPDARTCLRIERAFLEGVGDPGEGASLGVLARKKVSVLFGVRAVLFRPGSPPRDLAADIPLENAGQFARGFGRHLGG